MHSGFTKIRDGMSFNLCFLEEVPTATAEAMAEVPEVLALWESCLARPERRGGPYLCGAFSGADVLFATMAVRLLAFRVPAAEFPLARAYMDAVVAAPPVKAWLDQARAMTPMASY